MLNIEDFVLRLQILFDYYNISASTFADALTVQRSSLSHLMSGRNKPSLDFVMRITEAYPEADLYWLLYGKGDFPKIEGQATPPPAPLLSLEKDEVKTEDLFSNTNNTQEDEVKTEEKEVLKEPVENLPPLSLPGIVQNIEIEQIVVFYKNGTFKNYTPGN